MNNPSTISAAAAGTITIADLEQFRSTSAQHLERELTALGATLSRFTGEIAVEYSLQDWVAEA